MKLYEFYIELLQDIKSQQISEEEGGTQEQIFTNFAIDLLTDSGETENARACFNRKEDSLGRTIHKINGYSLSENYETLDIFISNFKGLEEIRTFTKHEAESASKQAEKFFKNAIFKDYIYELEESSEVFDLAHTLAEVKEIKEFLTRVNIFILTDGLFKSDIPFSKSIDDYSIFTRVIDIEYLYNLSDISRIPIEIDFEQYGSSLPCIKCPIENDEYESYLVLLSGKTLANIYEQYGARLLEQNVRSFLQFTGKINKGIRNTIREEPHMFLAFNNGIAVTAEEISFVDLPEGGKAISWAKDFQIVNGGQTTASIYHTWKKDKANIDNIFVQTKLTLIKDRENLNEIVNRIAEYSNTQNKVSTSDLSSNNPFHIEMEKLSRSIWALPVESNNIQTRWFYERARGQYRNTRNKEGFTKAKKKAFDLRNPRKQLITKVNLAKYLNSCVQIYKGKKLVIAPHIVVRGSQKNYVQFLSYNMPKKPDKSFFEHFVAKAILFKTSEKIYGVKPNSIGDMRYVTVPYSIGWLNFKTEYKIDFNSIWKQQNLTDKMQSLLYDIMIEVESFIKDNAPGSLYGEWAKKEECWLQIREQNFLSVDSILDELSDKDQTIETDDTLDDLVKQEELRQIKNIGHAIWSDFHNFFEVNKDEFKARISFNIARKLKNDITISDSERHNGVVIINYLYNDNPELFSDKKETEKSSTKEIQVNISAFNVSLIKKMSVWENKARVLSDSQRSKLYYLANGFEKVNDYNRLFTINCLNKMLKQGFSVNEI